MKDFFKSKKFKVILCIAAFSIGIMLYAALSSSTAVSSGLGAILSPIQRASESISSWVRERIDMLINAGDYYEENQRLRDEINELNSQMVDYLETKQENEHLREMVGLAQSSPGIEFSEPCTVIGRTANDIFGSFFIDKGTKDGVSINDPVVTKDGLVGFITEAEYTYSRVTPITSNELSIGVYCVRTGETGVTQGSFELAEEGILSMIYVPLDCEMSEGDIIVTSGYSGLVPKGLVVGKIGETEIAPNGLSRIAEVTPSCDAAELKTVYVIVDFDGKGSGYEQ
ncbi:MAG TPA: rod shape-determining protein MreC [Candidatus Faeciplasma gallinarum]|uniref:Cell shape-determining protein MreC n=1 Tax=Candidatus Faeciplasma gallinarum TaxID=2840799 RepID=A0A9D1EN97_9FIRM|nr:rod shape-determining protein MreC [Candidatus Faeciplasma gallinarum]